MINYPPGTEYYAIKRYARDNTGGEIYATDIYGNNFYLNIGIDEELKESLAKRNDNNIYYAKDCKGNFILPVENKKPYYFFDKDPIFPINNKKIQVYATWKECQIYPNDGITDIYLKDLSGNQVYAKNSTGQCYYGSKIENSQHMQFYATDRAGNNIFIHDENGNRLYLVNLTLNRPIYEVHQGKEIYQKIDNTEIYGRLLNKLPVYAKNKDEECLAVDKNQLPYYAHYNDIEFYPKTSNKKQYYRTIKNKEIYAHKQKGIQYYTKDKALNENLARDEFNNAYYCTNLNVETYPETNNGDQYYKNINHVECAALDKNNLTYYAKKNNEELFYPMDFSKRNDVDSSSSSD